MLRMRGQEIVERLLEEHAANRAHVVAPFDDHDLQVADHALHRVEPFFNGSRSPQMANTGTLLFTRASRGL